MIRRVYLDYCATTPVHPAVREAMLAALGDSFGNPSSLHWAGQDAAQVMADARAQVARAIGAQPPEVCFTSGATEADNLALWGVLRASAHRRHLITSAVEHHAILHAAQAIARDGWDVTYLPVDECGRVDPTDVERAIRPDTGLISVMMVNNEVGTIQPIAEIGRIARRHGIPLHTDAVQALGLLDIDVDSLGVDLLSLSAHKIYGPKGVGALYVRHGVPISPLFWGGAQEARLRPGTENVPGIAGLGAAAALTTAHKAEERERLAGLRRRLMEGLMACIPGAIVNGPPVGVAPHVVSAGFAGADGELLLFRLNAQGIAVSMGSACTSESMEPSHVLTAMGLSRERIAGTLRISLGYPTTADDIAYLLDVLPRTVRECQEQ